MKGHCQGLQIDGTPRLWSVPFRPKRRFHWKRMISKISSRFREKRTSGVYIHQQSPCRIARGDGEAVGTVDRGSRPTLPGMGAGWPCRRGPRRRWERRCRAQPGQGLVIGNDFVANADFHLSPSPAKHYSPFGSKGKGSSIADFVSGITKFVRMFSLSSGKSAPSLLRLRACGHPG